MNHGLMVGESLVGDGNEVALIDLMIGPKGGPVGAAFAQRLAAQTSGHNGLLAVLAPNVPAKPDTVMFNKVTIKGANQAVQMFGPAQAAVAKFKATADAYPSTDAGIFARYQEGATWAYLGNLAQAISAYQQVVDRAGDSFYGQMAKLGMAQAQALDGKYEQAINGFKELAQRKDGPLPVDGILMQLGKAYLDAGKRADAQQTFTRLVEEYPESPFTGDARRELETLKKT